MSRPTKIALLLIILPTICHASTISRCVSKIENAYRTTPAISAKFRQDTYVALTEQTISKSGLFYYMRGGKFRLEYSNPHPRAFVSDGKVLWIFTPGKDDITSQKISEDTLPPAALSFLEGFPNLRADFSVSKSRKFKNAGECNLTLIPKKKTTFEKLDVAFDKKGYINEMIITNKSGNTSRYRFFEIRIKPTLPPALFLPQ